MSNTQHKRGHRTVEPEFAQLSARIGQRLRNERMRRGWSLNELSKRTQDQYSKSRISNYEQGIRRMGLEAACQLAAAFGDVTPAWLLLLDECGPLTVEERALVEGFRALDKAGRQRLLDLIPPAAQE
ncbi:Helix-turn-helix domain-containing protein [Allochromatium warmingii]|uniref:Helix-turn-helix domain-containing protein n=1 Tax=Allochromatium warmingii TaxID=61595 RepID=A0A1H3I9V6_ALLWA|nr:helix-turn-helix transcriptional regulator [Allochromatium warmingii]SDY24467.1 Helix-turn-helix domain-containing protein [Allochromatium warmingii]